MAQNYKKESGFTFRKEANDGWWSAILLPASLLSFGVRNEDPLRFICVLCCSMTFIWYLSQRISGLKAKELCRRHLMSSGSLSIISSIIISYLFPYHFITLGLCIFTTVELYNWLVIVLIKHFPGSFTIGEAQIITQGVILFLISCSISLEFVKKLIFSSIHFDEEPIGNSLKFLQFLLLGCLALLYVLNLLPFLKIGHLIYITVATVIVIMLLVLNVYLGENPITWLAYFCVEYNRRIFLLLFWTVSTFACIAFVVFQNRDSKDPVTTSTRKWFHLIVIMVFVPGLLFDVEFLNLASGIALAVFLALETCRVLEVSFFASITDDAFQIFLDEKDSGTLILTHIYLLVGCASPLWLYSYDILEKGYHIMLLSGVLSVGVGDTVAALWGSAYGRHKWKGSNKTLEGTMCAIVVQLACAFPLLYIGHKLSLMNLLITATAVVLTSVLEAKTSQVDNLVLPLFMFCFLSWIQ